MQPTWLLVANLVVCCCAVRYQERSDDSPVLLQLNRLRQVAPPSKPVSIMSAANFTAPQATIQKMAAQYLQLADPQQLQCTKDWTDEFGQRHVRFQQVHPVDGSDSGTAKVLGGDIIVHLEAKTGAVYAITGNVAQDIKVPATTVSRDAAIKKASAEAERKLHRGSVASAAFQRSMELLVVPTAGGDALAWCGQAPSMGNGTAGELQVCIDAQGTADVLESRDVLQTASVATTATGNYYTASIITNSIGTSYEMRDPSRGNMATKDLKKGQDFTAATIYQSANNKWSDRYAVDAHYAAKMTWDYYLNVHGRRGIANDGQPAHSHVHYVGSAEYGGPNNAVWNLGGCKCMVYGDGDGITYKGFTSLDVVGHEMTHGVVAATAGLYYGGESGGLNEAMADIFGTMVEFYANHPSDKPDYLLGEKIVIKSGGFFRSMERPSIDGYSRDCYSSDIGNINVHFSSGPFNHWFYLLSGPTTGRTSACTGKVVKGLGNAKAAKIVYRALTTYMVSSTGYVAAVTATMNAAKDLYRTKAGTESVEEQAVRAAWTAIKVTTTATPVDCVVSDWGQWEDCSASCGGGSQTHRRQITVQPSNGGKQCPALEEAQSCNTDSCGSGCTDIADWTYPGGFVCSDYANDGWCANYGSWGNSDGVSANQACCVCGGGNTAAGKLRVLGTEGRMPNRRVAPVELPSPPKSNRSGALRGALALAAIPVAAALLTVWRVFRRQAEQESVLVPIDGLLDVDCAGASPAVAAAAGAAPVPTPLAV